MIEMIDDGCIAFASISSYVYSQSVDHVMKGGREASHCCIYKAHAACVTHI